MSTILVVDDNRPLAENIAELFEDEGHEVTLAATAPEAVAAAAERHFDLAIVDVRLPGQVDGVSLVPRLRRDKPPIAGIERVRNVLHCASANGGLAFNQPERTEPVAFVGVECCRSVGSIRV